MKRHPASQSYREWLYRLMIEAGCTPKQARAIAHPEPRRG